MKKRFILGLAILLGTISDMRGQPAKHLSDQEIQQKLTGIWVTAWGHGQTTTDVIAADGSFVSKTIGLPKGQIIQYRGKFQAKDGMVFGKAMFGKQTVVMHLHIIRLDSHELVWSNDAGITEPPFHKVAK